MLRASKLRASMLRAMLRASPCGSVTVPRRENLSRRDTGTISTIAMSPSQRPPSICLATASRFLWTQQQGS